MDREARLQQQKEWREANRARRAAYMKEWRANNKQRITKYTAEYRAANPAYHEWQRQYGKNRYERVIKPSVEQLARLRARSSAYDKAHPEKLRARGDRYNKEHRAERAAQARVAYHSKSEEARRDLRTARADYQRQWRETHKEEQREFQKKYREENSQRLAERTREYYAANRDRLLERAKARAVTFSDEERQKAYARSAAWGKAHPEDLIAYVHARRTRVKGAGGRYTAADIAALRELQGGKCAGLRDARCDASSEKGLTVDHVMPVYLGGSSDPANLQLLCKSCNSRKQRMHPELWAARLG